MLLKKLIIAEDDEDIAFLISTALGDAGFLCLRARNGEDALNLARTETPDALVLDVMMPRMDGIEVCRRIKSDVILSRVPILLLTSLADVTDRVTGLEAGADDYLAKPFDVRELAARVKALIRSSRRERERNPVTGLPSGESVDEHVVDLLRRKQPFGLLYIDIENFRTYADVYGFRKAEEVVSQTGTLILQQARAVTDPAPFVGHVGGDDFIVICRPEVSEDLRRDIADVFLAGVEAHYSQEDQERGFLLVPGEMGEPVQVGFMCPSVALVLVEASQFANPDELARAVTRAKLAVRRRTRSGAFPATTPSV